MEKKYLKLTNNLSGVNIIFFNVFPKDNDFIIADQDKQLIDEFLNFYHFSGSCLQKVFENDLLFATAVAIYLFKLGTDNTLKYAKRLKYLDPLQKILYSLLVSKKLDENAFKKIKNANKYVVTELFFARFSTVFTNFNDDFNTFYFEPSDKEGYIRCKNNMPALYEEKVNDTILFTQLCYLAEEIKTLGYSLDYHNTPFLNFVKLCFYNKGLDLLAKYVDVIQTKFDSISEYITQDEENNLDSNFLKNSLLEIISFGENFNRVARLIWKEKEIWRDFDRDKKIMITNCFLHANDIFDKALMNLDVFSKIYGSDYKYHNTFEIEIKYYRLALMSIFGKQISLTEFHPFMNKDDEIKSNSLALLRLFGDILDYSMVKGLTIANFCTENKDFTDAHFEYIRNDINQEYNFHISLIYKFLSKTLHTYKGWDLLSANILLREVYLDYVLKNNEKVAIDSVIKPLENNIDINTLFIVRKYNQERYHGLIENLSDNNKNQILEILKTSEEPMKLYGKEFCDELHKFCSC